jgi:hypothetical protein
MDGLKICGWPYLISCDEKYLPNQHITLRERERERERERASQQQEQPSQGSTSRISSIPSRGSISSSSNGPIETHKDSKQYHHHHHRTSNVYCCGYKQQSSWLSLMNSPPSATSPHMISSAALTTISYHPHW